jgi:hypothetical protein
MQSHMVARQDEAASHIQRSLAVGCNQSFQQIITTYGELMTRRLPPPWTIDEQDACFIVRDKNG